MYIYFSDIPQGPPGSRILFSFSLVSGFTGYFLECLTGPSVLNVTYFLVSQCPFRVAEGVRSQSVRPPSPLSHVSPVTTYRTEGED